jgi:hypothetical protein
LFFIQFVGRFIRWDRSLSAAQFADVFIPEHVTLIKYALEIERMVIDAEDSISTDGDGKAPERPAAVTIDINSDGNPNGFTYRQGAADQSESQKIKQALLAAGLSGKIADGEMQRFLKIYTELTPGAAEILTPSTIPVETTLRKQNERLVSAIFRESSRQGRCINFDEINWAANKNVGIPHLDKLTNDSTLQRRLEFLKQMLVTVRKGGDEDAARTGP